MSLTLSISKFWIIFVFPIFNFTFFPSLRFPPSQFVLLLAFPFLSLVTVLFWNLFCFSSLLLSTPPLILVVILILFPPVLYLPPHIIPYIIPIQKNIKSLQGLYRIHSNLRFRNWACVAASRIAIGRSHAAAISLPPNGTWTSFLVTCMAWLVWYKVPTDWPVDATPMVTTCWSVKIPYVAPDEKVLDII